MKETTLNYKSAGVDVEAGYEAVARMKRHVKKTFNQSVLTDLGNFGGLYALGNEGGNEPVLVSGTDGVGTKLKLAFDLDKHDTIGIDCVAMCVNDIICHGAKPLFFLDYLATGHLEPEKAEQIVAGIAKGCMDSGSALIGGETAEMPGFYSDGEYDLAGFSVGAVDKSKIITGEKVSSGDQIIAVPSSGVHSNGFSLVRKIIEIANVDLNDVEKPFDKSIGEVLLEPTQIYVDAILPLVSKFDLSGIAHITGGGFYENIPRILKDGQMAKLNLNSYELPEIFKWLEEKGKLKRDDMYHTFNMGVGMVIVVKSDISDAVIDDLKSRGYGAFLFGEIVDGEKGVELCLE